jgi:HEAT repeat protein
MNLALRSTFAVGLVVAAAGVADAQTDNTPSEIAAGEERGEAKAAPPDADFLWHRDGSATITVAAQAHVIPPRQVRRRAAELLAGQESIVFRMDDWSEFESVGEFIPDFYELGVRRVTLRIVADGKEEIRTIELQPPSLADRIASGAAEVRTQALAELESMLASDEANQRIKAMNALYETRQARLDRAAFLPAVRRSLDAANDREFLAAVQTIALVGGGKSDVPKLVGRVDRADPTVRATIGAWLCGLDPDGTHPDVGPAIEKLLRDENSWVRTTTFKALWGCPSTPGVDAALIELSRGDSKGGGSQADETIYYALSTRPLVRRPVAERLHEIIEAGALYANRAVWGISHHRADDEARPMVVDALIDVIDAEVDANTRYDAIWGLGLHGGDKAYAKLDSIARDPNESPKLRDLARSRLPQDRRLPDEAADPVSVDGAAARGDQPLELWEQIAQPQDPELRKTALVRVEEMLADHATALEALTALIKARDAVADRAALIPLMRPLAASDDEKIRAAAVAALAQLGGDAVDAETIVNHAADASPLVRQAAAEALLQVDPTAEHPSTGQAVEKLLGDNDSRVVLAAIRAVAGHPTTPAAEENLIDLSFHAEFSKDAVYYALSTRPTIRLPVAERLIDLAEHSERHRGRAIWGLTHHRIADEARDLVVDALVRVVDESADGYDRSNAIHGLGQIDSPKARERLQQIVDAADESDAAKERARSLLARP